MSLARCNVRRHRAVLHHVMNRLLPIAAIFFALTASGATFTVTTTADSGSGSLRDAITAANAAPGADSIRFELPPAEQAISPLSALPAITESVEVAGEVRAGSSTSVTLDGTNAGATSAITIFAASNVRIERLIIARWNGDGIAVVSGAGVVIASNEIREITGDGVRLDTGVANQVLSNVITAAERGVVAIGGETPIISGNRITAITGSGIVAKDTRHFLIGAQRCALGVCGRANTINGVSGAAIAVHGGSGLISGNRIGDVEANLADAIAIDGCRCEVTSNSLHRSANGVRVHSGSSHVHQNAFSDNRELPIDIGGAGREGADPQDADQGANNLQNAPSVSDAFFDGLTIWTRVGVSGNPGARARVDVYAAAGCSAFGPVKGAGHIGTRDVTLDSSGNATIPAGFLAADSPFVTAITTVAGATSEFSPCAPVTRTAAREARVVRTMTQSRSSLTSGSGVTYTLEAIIEEAPAAATVLSWKLPAETEFGGVRSTNTQWCLYAEANHELSCATWSQAPGERYSVEFALVATASAPVTFISPTDPASSTSIISGAAERVSLSVTAPAVVRESRGATEFTLTLRNDSDSTATNVILAPTMPAGVSLRIATPFATCERGFPCNIGFLKANESIQIAVSVTSTSWGDYPLAISVSSDQPETAPADNMVSVDVNQGERRRGVRR